MLDQFAQNIRKWCAGLSLREAAKKLGISHMTVKGLLEGRAPTEKTIETIAAALGKTNAQVRYGKDA